MKEMSEESMNDKEKLRGYRGLIRRDIDELEVRLNAIEAKIDRLSEKLDKHIDFIDDTYEGLKNPIQAAKRFLGR